MLRCGHANSAREHARWPGGAAVRTAAGVLRGPQPPLAAPARAGDAGGPGGRRPGRLVGLAHLRRPPRPRRERTDDPPRLRRSGRPGRGAGDARRDRTGQGPQRGHDHPGSRRPRRPELQGRPASGVVRDLPRRPPGHGLQPLPARRHLAAGQPPLQPGERDGGVGLAVRRLPGRAPATRPHSPGGRRPSPTGRPGCARHLHDGQRHHDDPVHRRASPAGRPPGAPGLRRLPAQARRRERVLRQRRRPRRAGRHRDSGHPPGSAPTRLSYPALGGTGAPSREAAYDAGQSGRERRDLRVVRPVRTAPRAGRAARSCPRHQEERDGARGELPARSQPARRAHGLRPAQKAARRRPRTLTGAERVGHTVRTRSTATTPGTSYASRLSATGSGISPTARPVSTNGAASRGRRPRAVASRPSTR